MIDIFKESKNLYFEPLEEKHLTENYISWLNDKEVTKFNSHGIYPNTLLKTKEYINSIQNDSSKIVLAIIEKATTKHIGNISIQSINFINSNADIAILLGDKTCWGKGYATEGFSVMIEHCFNKLNLHKVTAGTTCDNIAMQKVLLKLKMTQEANLKDAVKRDGKFLDIYTYRLINNE